MVSRYEDVRRRRGFGSRATCWTLLLLSSFEPKIQPTSPFPPALHGLQVTTSGMGRRPKFEPCPPFLRFVRNSTASDIRRWSHARGLSIHRGIVELCRQASFNTQLLPPLSLGRGPIVARANPSKSLPLAPCRQSPTSFSTHPALAAAPCRRAARCSTFMSFILCLSLTLLSSFHFSSHPVLPWPRAATPQDPLFPSGP